MWREKVDRDREGEEGVTVPTCRTRKINFLSRRETNDAVVLTRRGKRRKIKQLAARKSYARCICLNQSRGEFRTRHDDVRFYLKRITAPGFRQFR